MSKTVGSGPVAPRLLHERVDAAARAVHPHVLHRHRAGRLHAGRVQDDTAGRGAHRRGCAADDHRYSTLPSGRAVAPETAPRGVGIFSSRPGEVVAEELAARLEAVRDEQGAAVRVPLGADVAGQVQLQVGLLARRHVPHHRLPASAPLVPDEQPGVARHGREAQHLQAELLGAAAGVVQLGDRRAVGAHHAQRGVHRVPVLRVLHGDQRAVVGEVADARRLAVPVQLHRRLARTHQVDRRAVLVGGAADDRRAAVAAEGEARRVRGVQARGGQLVLAAGETLPAPDAELVAVLVVEPPDPLAVRGEHPVRRAVRPVRHLALLTGGPVPGVQLVRPCRVRHEQGTVGASSAQSGRDTRGARKRFSQCGISPVCCTRSVWWSARSGASDPLLSVMTPYCPSGRASRVLGPQPVDNFLRNFHRTLHTM